VTDSRDLFERAYKVVAYHEGLYTNDSSDPGGPTKYGISLKYLHSKYIDIDGDGDVDIADVRALTEEKAKDIYYKDWWLPSGYQNFSSNLLSIKMFDLAINIGPIRANKVLQRAVRAVTGIELVEDGILGHNTTQAVNSVKCKREILIAVRSEAAGYYRLVVQNNPITFKKFLKGWLNRAYS